MNDLNNLKKQLKEVSQLIDNKSISLIEIDICMEKMRSAYQMLSDLKQGYSALNLEASNISKDNTLQEKETPKAAQTPKLVQETTSKASKKMKEVKSESTSQQAAPMVDKKEPAYSEEKASQTSDLKDVKKEESTFEDAQEKAEEQTPKKDNKKKDNNSSILNKPQDISLENKESVADQFVSKKSINDHLKQMKKDNKDLASFLQKRPISDLKTAISINDKMGFIRDLFEGDSSSYEHFIESVNKAGDLDKALELVEQCNWKKNKEASQIMVELIIRRFL